MRDPMRIGDVVGSGDRAQVARERLPSGARAGDAWPPSISGAAADREQYDVATTAGIHFVQLECRAAGVAHLRESAQVTLQLNA